MPRSTAHIAGVGACSLSQNETLDDLAISAGTKALLDAGVTYSSVDQSIACFLDERERIPRKCFDAFGMEGAVVCEVDNSAGLLTAVQSIRSGQSNCVLVLSLDREASSGSRKTQPMVVAFVLVSQLFLTSHAYLKDSSVRIRACTLTSRFHSRSGKGGNDARTVKTAVQTALRQAQLQNKDLQVVDVNSGAAEHLREALEGAEITQPQEPWSSSSTAVPSTGWSGVSRLVYQLRGWATSSPTPQAKNCLHYTTNPATGSAGVLILSRSDGQPAPSWNDIKNIRDGRERLGYNPAVEVRAITREDLLAVRAREEFTDDALLGRLRLPLKGGDRAALARL